MSILKIGIECENLEDSKSRWGVGQITFNLLKEYAANPEWQKQYKLYLYFKKVVPDDEVFKNPIFVKRVLGFPSFNVFYHVLMPLRAMIDRLDRMFFPAYQLPPLYLGKSIVMLTQDVYYEYKYGSLPFRYRLSYRLFTNWAAKFATKILAISETSKKEVSKLYKINPDKIFVGYLGVDLNQNVKIKNQNDNSKLKNNEYILFVGQMFPRRHARETILAFEKLIMEYSHILKNMRISELRLIAVGPDKYGNGTIKSLVEEVNKRLGREAVIHRDYVNYDELNELYSGAKTLVYVSDREAFGLPPMEALSFGVPSVIMDNELGHELFGEYAFYSKSGETDKIASTIKEALTDQQKIEKIKSEGPNFVKKYNWKSFADKFLNELSK
ncbi:MAG: glycosyltransferase family 1 protein [bacterium]|nr:glycosyltransferase family 1 protein [bacterium]